MAYKSILKRLATPATFLLIGVVARLIPHAPNFAPIGAMALFGGTYLDKKQAFVLPMFAMILSDYLIGFDSLAMRITVYGSFLLTTCIGLWIKKHNKFENIVTASLTSSILFFLTTNFTVWATGTMYTKNVLGLMDSYFMAVPFFRNTLLGDLFYTGIFFGGYELIKQINTSHPSALARRV